MALDITKPADSDSIAPSAGYIRENFRALLQDKFTTGSTAPTSSQGQNGFLYFDTTTQKLYLKDNGTWSELTTTALPTATSSVAGIAKLYTETGSNTDGSITQSGITSALGNKLDATASAITTALGNTAVAVATKATQDASGNVITTTYATKATAGVADWSNATTLSASGRSFTAPSAGFYIMCWHQYEGNTSIKLNGTEVAYINPDDSSAPLSITIPVKTSDVLTYSGNNSRTAFFVPLS